MKLITMISKFEEGNGYSYTTEYASESINDVPRWEEVDDSWVDELIKNEPEHVDFECWYEVVNDDGKVIDVSGKFWVRE